MIDVVTMPVWVAFGTVVALAVVFRGVRLWLACVCVVFGVYLAATAAGDPIRGLVGLVGRGLASLHA